jgi:hypothetical protein
MGLDRIAKARRETGALFFFVEHCVVVEARVIPDATLGSDLRSAQG